MSVVPELRQIDFYDYYSSKIAELGRYIRQHARTGHGHYKLRKEAHRIYRNGPRPRGIHDYHNLQWDPSVFRGRTFRDFREKNLPPSSTTVDFNKYCCFDCNTTRGPTVNRRKTVIGLPRLKVGGVFRPTTDEIIFEETSGRKRHKQDESRKEMEPFIIEQLEPPEYTDIGVQSDEIKEAPRKHCQRISLGTSTGSQADICIIGTGNKDDPLQPILTAMGSKVVEQSLLETFEEFEFHSIRSQIRTLIEKRRNRQARAMKKVTQEQYKAEMLEHEKIRRGNELQVEIEANNVIAALVFSISVRNVVTTNAFNSLRQHGFLASETHDAEAFIPRVHKQMYKSLQVPRMIVNDIIQKVEMERVSGFTMNTLLDGMEKVQVVEELSEEEGEATSSAIPPPNTASSLPYSTSEEEDDSAWA